jgi:hypothetical protein
MKSMKRKSFFQPVIPLDNFDSTQCGITQGRLASFIAITFSYWSSLFVILIRFILLGSAETMVKFRSL